MTISVDTRFDNNYDEYMIEYLRKPTPTKQWLSLTTLLAMEDNATYADAIDFVKDTSFIGPCYIIIGGVEKNEGAVLSMDRIRHCMISGTCHCLQMTVRK